MTDPKISQDTETLRVEHDIFRLDVAMYNIMFVKLKVVFVQK